jgi:DNA repair protein RecN (Recombination protein N)
MPKAQFEMRLFALPQAGPGGLERGEFYLAANLGEDSKPLAWIASGGELSRIMLALRRAAPGADHIPTLIFDEVDAGIGGVAASAVGQKLQAIAREAQVLCITHLPQVAAFADHHYRVEKQEREGRTCSGLVHLEGEQRIEEMARMLGGAQVTERTLEHAREIVAQSAPQL